MSNEPDYNFNDPVNSSTPESGPSLHLPFALLTITVAILMIGQTMGTFTQRSALKEGKTQIAEARRVRTTAVDDAGKIEKKLSDIVTDLLILAKTDDDAKAIVNAFGIQQGAGSGAPTAEPPAAKP